MDSKILFKNETTYTPEIAMEAGDAFWKIQPAYRKRAKRFKIASGILAVTFMLLAVMAIRENGVGVVSVGAIAMSVMALIGFIKGEKLIKGSAKNLQAMNTRVTYGVSENFFFVLNREYIRRDDKNEQQSIEAPDEDDDVAELEGPEDPEADETSETTELAETEDEEDEYADELLSLEDLLVCVVTENLYILIWEKPYYILDRRRFEDDKDLEFRQFIEEKVDIIEA